jgi:putative tricarboxylic transport membrane protein
VDSRGTLARATPSAPLQPGAAWRVLGLVAALVAFALLLPVLGYVVCAAALFVAAAWLLDAPRDWRVPVWGWALAAVVFLVFDRLIGLTLPTGPWGF